MFTSNLNDLRPHPLNADLYQEKAAPPDFLASVEKIGILNPLLILKDGTIISGHRRYLAAKMLGLAQVPTRICRLNDPLAIAEAIIESNRQREKTFSQKMREAEMLEEIEAARARERQGMRTDIVEIFPQSDEMGKSRDKVAERVGIGSGRQYDKAKKIWEAAKEDGGAQGLIERLDAGEATISRAYDTIRKQQKAKRDAQQVLMPVAGKLPVILVGDAASLDLDDESVDVIITSPPYNLGSEQWPMGGEGRQSREGIGYQDARPEDEYQVWQLKCLQEWHRVAKQGASLFYNHKVRQKQGEMIHPLDWLRNPTNPWILRQEIVWDRGSTHNHCPSLFWPHDERIYWMTKGKPIIPEGGIGLSSVWTFHGPEADTWHPAPFPPELPRRCLKAIGRKGIIVLDPFAGRCTTLKVATEEFGHDAIGVDISEEYLERAKKENKWMNENES